MSDQVTPLPVFNFEPSSGEESQVPISSASEHPTSTPTPAGSSSLLQVPASAFSRPRMRLRLSSAQLESRNESDLNTNSIYRRGRAATISTPLPSISPQEKKWEIPFISPNFSGRDTVSTRGASRRRRALSALNPWSGSPSEDARVDDGSGADQLRDRREEDDRQVIDLLDVIGLFSLILHPSCHSPAFDLYRPRGWYPNDTLRRTKLALRAGPRKVGGSHAILATHAADVCRVHRRIRRIHDSPDWQVFKLTSIYNARET